MRVRIFFGTLLVLILNAGVLFAQGPGGPCELTDPDENCPLDTWVVILAVVAVVFAVVRLHRKQKALRNHA
jgi:hypothetical protein